MAGAVLWEVIDERYKSQIRKALTRQIFSLILKHGGIDGFQAGPLVGQNLNLQQNE